MAILKQKRARIYKDFDLSFGKNSLSGDINKKLDVNAVKQAMINLVMTQPFERPFNPLLGSEINNLLFEHMDTFTSDAIQKNLLYLFRNYEPRCRITDLRVKPYYDLNEYVVSIDFHITGINEPQELEVRLERLR